MMNGKVVAITGASRGIGAAAARVFAETGAKVALIARSAAEIEALVAEIGADRAMALACDVADAAAVSAAVAQIVARWSQLDVLINNAGMIEPIARIENADPALWAQAVQVNLAGVFNGIRAALPVMKSAGAGTIITISSGAAHRPLEGWSAYCASKAGAAMLTRALHLEEGQWLRVMGLSPGTVATGMQVQIKASGINPVSQLEVTDHIPADWPARALLWMCGDGAEAWRGEEISLRDEDIRRKVGLVA
ncbi:SDR family oxidoreductase [Gemmobacter lutimaris]|uniref:SDR family oxidoreductase n=2 Tax=Gemmobacter lutimaris TaxID=2306023 RepID=A0A398BQQ2_9RHOB|nr:SDR family oxidoreductase [Gemmobacter lutimaris]RID92945.1 SDR family oxidoreductase [Gemmobacter lutimaris]